MIHGESRDASSLRLLSMTVKRGDMAHLFKGEPWFDRPMRWAQLTLVEDDPAHYDLGFWLDYFKRTHSDAACLSAGGCVAYYPTRIPFHHRSAWMGDTDPLGDLIQGCRELGMVVLAAHRPPLGLAGRLRGPSRVDRRGCRGQSPAALGFSAPLGHVRAGAVQFRVYDRGSPRDHDPLSRGGHL